MSVASIYVPVDEVWDFYERNKERLQEETPVVAENLNTGIQICLSDEDSYLCLIVYDDKDKPLYEEGILSERDSTETARRVYSQYLSWKEKSPSETPQNTKDTKEKEEVERINKENDEAEREDLLLASLLLFLKQATKFDEIDDVIDFAGMSVVQSILEDFLDHLEFTFEIPIDRPEFCYETFDEQEIDTDDFYNPPYGSPDDEYDDFDDYCYRNGYY